jgi:hypothetical protein
MNKYDDLEICILSCLLIKPDLMKNIKFEDKHIRKHKGMWKFMKAFYSKFGNFDINLMHSVCKDKWHIINYIELLACEDGLPCYFEDYQNRLIEKYNETQKDDYIIDKIYDLNMDLICRRIKTNDYKYKIDEIFEKANKIYEGK